MENKQQEVSLDSVFCRLEMKEMDEVAERRTSLYDCLLEGLRMQYSISCGQVNSMSKKARKKFGGPLTLREFGLLITRIGIDAIRSSENPDDDDEEEDDDGSEE